MNSQALEGIVVVGFTAFAAGPFIAKYMANHGAFVIKVESASRPEGFRTHYPPFKDNIQGWNRSGVFAMNNDCVYSVGLNLKVPAGVETAKKLVAKADVVVENFTPGTMRKLGLSYDLLEGINPRLVMLSTCNLGQTGPRAKHPGFGSQLTSLSGFTNLTGEAGGPPLLIYGPYIDYIAVGYGYIAILAALEHRRKTGRGQYIDLAQYEGGTHFLAPALLEYQLLGTSPGRQGNHHLEAAPHGVYRCAGEDSWCVISVMDTNDNDAEWKRLVEAMGSPAWASSLRFATQLARKENEAELDSHIGEWTRTRNAQEVMETLQKAGVHAGKVNNIPDLFTDPQLAHRRYWRPVVHKEVGRHHAMLPAYNLSATPCADPRPEPCLCEHTEMVLEKLLGLSKTEIDELASQGAVELAESLTPTTSKS
ncbi:MAG: CoA transferase [Acidobacteria bacterium]|nr:CoA transferase [Acidobacteriota bacterium]